VEDFSKTTIGPRMSRANKYIELYEGFKLGELGKSAPKGPGLYKAEKKITKFSIMNDVEVYWEEDFDMAWAHFLKEPVPTEDTQDEYKLHLKLEPFLNEIKGVGVVIPKLRISVVKDNKLISLTLVVPKTLQLDSWDEADKWIKNQVNGIKVKGLSSLADFPDQWVRYIKPDPKLNRPYIPGVEELKREELKWREYVVPALEKIFLRGKDLILDFVVPTLSQQEDQGVWVPYLLISSYITKDKRATPLHFDGFRHKTLSFTTRKQGRDWIQKMKPEVQKLGLAAVEFPNDWKSLKNGNEI
jgi:hypothetical protein